MTFTSSSEMPLRAVFSCGHVHRPFSIVREPLFKGREEVAFGTTVAPTTRSARTSDGNVAVSNPSLPAFDAAQPRRRRRRRPLRSMLDAGRAASLGLNASGTSRSRFRYRQLAIYDLHRETMHCAVAAGTRPLRRASLIDPILVRLDVQRPELSSSRRSA